MNWYEFYFLWVLNLIFFEKFKKRKKWGFYSILIIGIRTNDWRNLDVTPNGSFVCFYHSVFFKTYDPIWLILDFKERLLKFSNFGQGTKVLISNSCLVDFFKNFHNLFYDRKNPRIFPPFNKTLFKKRNFHRCFQFK